MSGARRADAPPRLWIHLAGPMQVTAPDGASLLPKSRKARAVLAILALSAPRPVSRVRLTNLLWSQREREQARGSLRQCLHEIQTLLHGLGPGLIEADREQLRLAEEAFWLDVRDADLRDTGALVEDLAGLDPAFDVWIREMRPSAPTAAPGSAAARSPRIGVRHLRALGGVAETTLAEGLGDEIATAISRFRWISAIAPDSLPLHSPESEVEYLLDGAVRQIGGQIRTSLRLQDMRAGGEVVWSRNFDGTSSDLLGFHDSLIEQTAAQVDSEMLLREGARAAARLAEGISDPWTLTLSAVPDIFRLERDGFERAGRSLEQAVLLVPDNPMANTWLAYWHILALGQGWTTDQGLSLERAVALADKAIMLDSSDARALTVAGHVRAFLGKQVDEALALHARALALNPALSWAWMMSGLSHTYAGNHEESISRIEAARRLSPFDPHAFFFDSSLMLPHLMLGSYQRARELGRLTAQIKPTFSSSWKLLLVALGHLDAQTEAAEVRARLLALEPGFTVQEAMERSPLRRPEDRDRFADGLMRGGLPN